MFDYSGTELQRIDETLEPALAWAQDRQPQCEQMALDASRLLSCTEDRLEQYANQGFFKRCWTILSGMRGSMERANGRDLQEMQKHAWRYINLLQERDLLLAHSIITVKNNLLTLAVGQNDVRDQVTRLADRVYDRFVALENRVSDLEVATNIHSWVLTVEAMDYDERFPPHMRVLRIVNDFHALKGSGWTSGELKFLRKGLREAGLDPKQQITVTAFVENLIDEIEASSFQVFDGLTDISGGRPDVGRNGFVIDAVSAPAFSALYQLKDNYTISSRVIRTLGKRLSMTHAEAMKATINDFVADHGIDTTVTVPLNDLAVELLGCLSLAHRLTSPTARLDHPTAALEDGRSSAALTLDDDDGASEALTDEEVEELWMATIQECLEEYQHGDFYVGDKISENKMKNARVNFPIAEDAVVIGLIDTTLFGGCSEGMAICLDGIYWHQNAEDFAKHKRITWGDLAAIKDDVYVEDKKLVIGEGKFNPLGSSVPPALLARMIKDMLDRLAQIQA